MNADDRSASPSDMPRRRLMLLSGMAGLFAAVWCLLDSGKPFAAAVAGLTAAPVTLAGLLIIGSDLQDHSVRRPTRSAGGLAAILLAQILPPLFAGRRYPHRGGGEAFFASGEAEFAITLVSFAGLTLAIRIALALRRRRSKSSHP
jgi:hypothetical protein